MQNYNYRTNDCARRSQYGSPYARTVPVAAVNSEIPSDAFCKMPVAMAYVPWQDWCNIYPLRKALCQGTLFGELDKPFLGKGGCCK